MSDSASSGSSDGGRRHTVRQHECVLSIADHYGLFWETIWKHPENDTLRQERQDPNILYPGDELFIPDARLKEEACGCEAKHRFRRRGTPIIFRLRLLEQEEPRADVPWVLRLEGREFSGTSDAEGMIEVGIPPGPQQGELQVGEGDEMEIIPVSLGGVDPLADDEGIRKRLVNLGYDCEDADDESLADAIASFQVDHDLEMTGEADDATRDKLRELHGC
ncbi:MAG: peptidoglycan-binding protein [Phycisphaerales bacterium]|nr:peptidoglycan-binding protein [Phycisphaerales bacterium]